MFADLGLRVVAADLDPQSNLTAAFLSDERLEYLWPDGGHPNTLFGCVKPLLDGTGDIADPHLEMFSVNNIDTGYEQLPLYPQLFEETEPYLYSGQIGLLVGDLLLSSFEDELSESWPRCLEGNPRAFRVLSAFWRIMQKAAEKHKGQIILMDLGPNLGAINRAALIAADFVVVPLSPDLFSLQGLRNLGPTLQRWREGWQKRLGEWASHPLEQLELPAGDIQPAGYVVLQHVVRMDRPVQAYNRWIARIPQEYRRYVLQSEESSIPTVDKDPECLSLIKHYRSLVPMAQEAHKPMFFLKPADGAIGSHGQAVRSAYQDFKRLARVIAERTTIPLPPQP